MVLRVELEKWWACTTLTLKPPFLTSCVVLLASSLTVLIKTTLESVIFSLLHQSVKNFFRCAGTRVCTHSAKLLPCCLLMGARVSWMSFSQVW